MAWSGRCRLVGLAMNDMDIGAAFMLLWIFFWSAFAFIAFVIVISILRALMEWGLGLLEKDGDLDE